MERDDLFYINVFNLANSVTSNTLKRLYHECVDVHMDVVRTDEKLKFGNAGDRIALVSFNNRNDLRTALTITRNLPSSTTLKATECSFNYKKVVDQKLQKSVSLGSDASENWKIHQIDLGKSRRNYAKIREFCEGAETEEFFD